MSWQDVVRKTRRRSGDMSQRVFRWGHPQVVELKSTSSTGERWCATAVPHLFRAHQPRRCATVGMTNMNGPPERACMCGRYYTTWTFKCRYASIDRSQILLENARIQHRRRRRWTLLLVDPCCAGVVNSTQVLSYIPVHVPSSQKPSGTGSQGEDSEDAEC